MSFSLFPRGFCVSISERKITNFRWYRPRVIWCSGMPPTQYKWCLDDFWRLSNLWATFPVVIPCVQPPSCHTMYQYETLEFNLNNCEIGLNHSLQPHIGPGFLSEYTGPFLWNKWSPFSPNNHSKSVFRSILYQNEDVESAIKQNAWAVISESSGFAFWPLATCFPWYYA